MSTRWFLLPALTLAIVSGQAAAKPRRTPFKITAVGTSSVAAASAAPAKAAPSAATDEDLQRDADRERRHTEMVDELAARRAAASLAAPTAAPLTLPHVTGIRLSDDDEAAFGYKGLSNFDQAGVNQGFSVEPPDQALCAGNGFVFEGVNDAFAVYSESGKLLAGPAQANAFYLVDFALNVSDPKCHYDRQVDRWFVTMTEYDNNFSDNHLRLAVSRTGDPTGEFIIYDINVTNDGSDFFAGDCPCLGDQPLIGADANGFYLSTNAFGNLSFQGAQIYVVSKSALARGVATATGSRFDQLSSSLSGAEFSFSIQPSITPPGASFAKNTEFLAQTLRAFRAEAGLVVWTVNNTSAIDGDQSKLSMSMASTSSQTYVRPVAAKQKDGPTPRAEISALRANNPANIQNLDGNDQRMSQLTYLGGQLWTTVGTAAVSDGTPVRDAIAWFVLNVGSGAGGATASVAAQGYLAGPNTSHLIYPAIGVNARGEAAIVFTLTGQQYFPSAAFWRFGEPSLNVLFNGTGPEDGFAAYAFNRPRWGDYSAAAIGPDGSIWMATEMIPGGVRKVSANWGTFIGKARAGNDDR